MLVVGLTGDLGSGKSTVAKMFAARGAVVLSSDEMGRAMMQPGESVYAEIVQHFGNEALTVDRLIDRAELAKIVFTENRLEELNAIVHPAVLDEQARRIAEIARATPDAVVVVESALIFLTRHAHTRHASTKPQGTKRGFREQPWSARFDRIVLVMAPEAVKIARYIERAAAGRLLTAEQQAALEADARRRLAAQTGSDDHAAECLVIRNDGGLEALEAQVNAVWSELTRQTR
jgi:dephospho-CoA kinase